MTGIHSDIVIENLCKKFGDQVVLDKFNAVFEKEKISFVMGESGAGKTTLFRILMGLERADSGIIKGLKTYTEISAVFQEDRLLENLTALKNIQLICERKINAEKICTQINELLPPGTEYKKVRELSKGMRQRVAIIRAMTAESDIVFMDEPFVGLDYKNKQMVLNYVKKNQRGRTILIITHDKEDAKYFDSHCVIIQKGVLIK